MVRVVSSSVALIYHTISEKRKSTSPSAIIVKNRQETVGTEEKLVIS
jgi:hypothetical protein